MRLGFVHTTTVLLNRFKTAMAVQHPFEDCFHVMNEGLQQQLVRGDDKVAVYRRMVQLLLLAAEDGADMLVLTCSAMAPAVDIARQVCRVPIINKHDPMAAEAVRLGRHIAVLCTDAFTPGPSAGLLRQHAAVLGREVVVETVVCPEASTALYAGDVDRHDSIVTDAAREAFSRSDLIVLGQASLSHLQRPLAAWGKPVLSGPSLLMADIARRLARPVATG